MLEEEIAARKAAFESSSLSNNDATLLKKKSHRSKNPMENHKNDLTQFLQNRINDYEKKQEEAQA